MVGIRIEVKSGRKWVGPIEGASKLGLNSTLSGIMVSHGLRRPMFAFDRCKDVFYFTEHGYKTCGKKILRWLKQRGLTVRVKYGFVRKVSGFSDMQFAGSPHRKGILKVFEGEALKRFRVPIMGQSRYVDSKHQ